MDSTRIIGISRGSQYSPNHIGNDAAIFNQVTEELRTMGHTVETYTEKEFTESGAESTVIYGMARDTVTLERLKTLENKGAVVINSAYGIDNCIRKAMTMLLTSHGVPHPDSLIVSTAVPYSGQHLPCWIKRGDSHAIEKEDVSYATTREEADAILASFRQRGIAEAVVNEHLQGDLVKFYGVRDTGFFHWFYPDPSAHSKFGLEKINGRAKGICFDEDRLKAYSDKASRVLDVPVYGGDCVVTPNGDIKIIDFNDWPSFACCRDMAGKKIAEYIHNMAIKQKI